MNKLLALSFAVFMMIPLHAQAQSWGAIAGDETLGERDPAYGVGGGGSEAEARKNALGFCRKAGGKKCEIMVTYAKCGAYAASRNNSGGASGNTEAEARKKALAECGSNACKIITTDCN